MYDRVTIGPNTTFSLLPTQPVLLVTGGAMYTFYYSSPVTVANGSVARKKNSKNYSIQLEATITACENLSTTNDIYIAWMETGITGIKHAGQMTARKVCYRTRLKAPYNLLHAFNPED